MTGNGLDVTGQLDFTANYAFQYAIASAQYLLDYSGPVAHCRLTLTMETDVFSGLSWALHAYPSGATPISSPGQGGAVISASAPSGVYVNTFDLPAMVGQIRLDLQGTTGPYVGGSTGFGSHLRFVFAFENIP